MKRRIIRLALSSLLRISSFASKIITTCKTIVITATIIILSAICSITAFADGDVAAAVQGTWDTAKSQVRTIVDNVVFPVIDVILAILLFAKIGTCYLDYRKHGQFEWTGPAILFASLVFSLTAPLYIWGIIGM